MGDIGDEFLLVVLFGAIVLDILQSLLEHLEVFLKGWVVLEGRVSIVVVAVCTRGGLLGVLSVRVCLALLLLLLVLLPLFLLLGLVS